MAEGIRHGETKHKRHLNERYLLALRRLIEILEHKTEYLLEHPNDSAASVEHFRSVDLQCRSSLDELNGHQVLTSSALVSRFIDSLNGIETIDTFNAVAALLGKSSEV